MFEPSEQEDSVDSKLSMDQNVTLQFDFHFESLSVVLYNNDVSQVCSKFLYLEINPQFLIFSFRMLTFFDVAIHCKINMSANSIWITKHTSVLLSVFTLLVFLILLG